MEFTADVPKQNTWTTPCRFPTSHELRANCADAEGSVHPGDVTNEGDMETAGQPVLGL